MATILDYDDCQHLDPGYKFHSDADGWGYTAMLSLDSVAETIGFFGWSDAEPNIDQDRELPDIFYGLARIWRDATGGLSSTKRRFSHPTYKAILRLGPEVVPYILNELKQRPDWWFDALEFLTKENPARSAESFEAAAAAWIEWGHSRPR